MGCTRQSGCSWLSAVELPMMPFQSRASMFAQIAHFPVDHRWRVFAASVSASRRDHSYSLGAKVSINEPCTWNRHYQWSLPLFPRLRPLVSPLTAQYCHKFARSAADGQKCAKLVFAGNCAPIRLRNERSRSGAEAWYAVESCRLARLLLTARSTVLTCLIGSLKRVGCCSWLLGGRPRGSSQRSCGSPPLNSNGIDCWCPRMQRLKVRRCRL